MERGWQSTREAHLLLLVSQAEERGMQQRPPDTVPCGARRDCQLAGQAQGARDKVGVGVRQPPLQQAGAAA